MITKDEYLKAKETVRLYNEQLGRIMSDDKQYFPTYNELVEALKDTHNLYIVSVEGKHMTHDITRVMGNDNIFKKLKR